MKSGLMKKVLAAILAMMLLAGNVTPVVAQSADGGEITADEVNSEEEESSEEESLEEDVDPAENNEEDEEETTETSEEETTESSEEENAEDSTEELTEETTEEIGSVSENDPGIAAFGLRSAAYEGDVAVTIKHYLAGQTEYTDADMIFTPEELFVENGESIAKFVKGAEIYDVNSITVDGVDVTEEYEDGQLPLEALSEEAEVAVYYEETTGTFKNGTNMFDYVDGNAWDSNSINYYGNYDGTFTGNYDADYNAAEWNNRISLMGAGGEYQTTKTQQGDSGSLLVNINTYVRNSKDPTYWNTNETSSMQNFPIITGLISGVSGDNYENVDFNYDEPGFFSADPKNGKKALEGYELVFNRLGAHYSLTKVQKDGADVCTDVSSFFPLNGEPDAVKDDKDDNVHFGMRYDFTFKVGDYIGEMLYTFTGDDDVWVCLDGDLILDLGGIHDPYPFGYSDDAEIDYAPNTVDIWGELLDDDYTVEDKIAYANDNASTEHTVTVLFMERGANLSNCYMDFVMPNIEAKKPVVAIVEAAELELVKKDAETKTAIADVEFTLTSASGAEFIARTDANGHLKFNNLIAGTYILTETAPTGYYAAGPWNVTVTRRTEDDGAKTIHSIENVAKSADSTAVGTENGAYVIENTKVELNQDKNAELKDWNNRVYKITLEASLEEFAGQTSITGANVIDYIDSRFVLTSSEGAELAVGTEIADAAGNIGVVKADENGQYVEWTNVALTTTGWSAVIYVKAKDEFIGGNMIPTNGAGSGVTVGPVTEEFDKPTVNVKLLDITLENGEITLFKGEQATPGAYMDELSDTLAVVNIEDEAVALAGGIPNLDETDVTALIQDKSVTKSYSYSSEEMGTFKYELVDDQDNDQWTDHEAKKVGEKVEDYTLKVSYTAKSQEDRAESMNGYDVPEENDGEEVTTVTTDETTEGIYYVNVVAGSLVITKTINTVDADFAGGDPIFTFKVMKDGAFHSYRTVRFTESDASATGNTMTKSVTVTGLAKGVYTVEECETMRYELESVSAAGVNPNPAEAASGDTTATFGIGRAISDEENTTVLNNRDGKAGFVNAKNNSRNFSDTDVVVNTFIIDENGNISWTADSLEGNR